MERVKTATAQDLPACLKQPVNVKHRIQAVDLSVREIIPHWTERRSSLWGPLRVLSWTAFGGGASFAIAWAIKDLYPYVRLRPKRVGIGGASLFFAPALFANMLRARFDQGTTRMKHSSECKRYAVPEEFLPYCSKDLGPKDVASLIDRTWKDDGKRGFLNRSKVIHKKHELAGWMIIGEDSYVHDCEKKESVPRHRDRVIDPDKRGIWANASFYTSVQRVVLSERLNSICKKQKLDGIFVPMMRLLPMEARNPDMYLKYATVMERPRAYESEETPIELKTLRPEMQRTLAKQLCRLIVESGLTKAQIRLAKTREHLVVSQCKGIGLLQEENSRHKPRLREECALVGLKNLVLYAGLSKVFKEEAQRSINRIRRNPWWHTIRLYRNLRYPPPPSRPLPADLKRAISAGPSSTNRTGIGARVRSLKNIVMSWLVQKNHYARR